MRKVTSWIVLPIWVLLCLIGTSLEFIGHGTWGIGAIIHDYFNN